MSNSSPSDVEMLETRPQSQAIDNENPPARPGTVTPPLIVDGEIENSIEFTNRRDSQSPLFVPEESPIPSTLFTNEALYPEIIARDGIQVIVPPVQRRWEYRLYEEQLFIIEVLEEYGDFEEPQFLVTLSDESEQKVSSASSFDEVALDYTSLIKMPCGVNALAAFKNQFSKASSDSDSDKPVTRRSTRQIQTNFRAAGFVDFTAIDLSSDDELTTARTMKASLPQKRSLARASKINSKRRASDARLSSGSPQSESASEGYASEVGNTGGRRNKRGLSRLTAKGQNGRGRVNYAEPVIDDYNSYESDDSRSLGKRKRGRPSNSGGRKGRKSADGSRQSHMPSEGTRRSERSGRAAGDMREIGEDDIPDTASAKAGNKFSGAKENYKELPQNNAFRLRHCRTCDTCNEEDDNEEKGQLIYCQGCTLSHHQRCLGPRTSRDHLVTKIGDQDFVLQCRRCIGIAQKKDSLAPKQGECFVCHEKGESCNGFREKKTSRQEQKDREDNEGEDPIEEVSPHLINNADNVLFRCTMCYRACHMHHLPTRNHVPSFADPSQEQLASERFAEYSKRWSCLDCANQPADIDSLVAWRPIDQDNYEPGTSTDLMPEDQKEYLVKYRNTSYFRTEWKSGAWVWGITSPAMRKAFARRDNENNIPKMRTEDAIPEEYLRIDIVLDVEYTNVVKVHVEKVDMARIKEVKKALVKFKGLGYEDVVWEEPPDAIDTQRWNDFKSAYEDWVLGRYVHLPASHSLSSHLSKVRSQNFEKKIMMHSQPETLTGGKLMEYQMEGLNWLYYRWHQRQNAILADEMGLGKTIQIIGFLATLQQRHKCWPFLIVVPNSTCLNWRREIKQWAPSLRVVAYYGSSEARKLAEKHELFPGGGRDLRCHIVVTSYEAAQHEDFRKVFRGVSWQGLIVDEGQRLKNDKNILYESLNSLKAPFKVLLTGTPLQNNPRELFNLLQFLDKSFDAQAMEVEYATLTKENVPQLHDLLRTLLLRRTKAQVLTFLPAMAQIIVPVTMSVVQKKLYKSIIAKNSDLIKSIFGAGQRSVKQTERANLNNVLMQLRKCLCHPFVYSRAIEERSSNAAISHRNLVEASSKLKLLEIMLPKLQERGHRVLIFSQFLDMLDIVEDFLDGLGLYYQRLDGSVSSLQKQKRIDEFNAPDSPLFAFLLSTRAGGVGINLASADTVIILDPDFNPHQDIQALSRAHRIGQQKKVLVFQLTTRGSAEEKIMQIGKRKMALDHALIEQMGAAEDDAGMDLESILRHGAEALFKEDDTHDIHYDSASIDKLLDRSQIENTQTGNDDSAESQFSFARVWANDKLSLEDTLGDGSEGESNIDLLTWETILKTREQEVAAEAAAKSEALGRGRRKRQTVDYTKQALHGGPGDSPAKRTGSRYLEQSDSDTDFEARGADSDGEESEDDGDEVDEEVHNDLSDDVNNQPAQVLASTPIPNRAPDSHRPLSSPKYDSVQTFKRGKVPLQLPPRIEADTIDENTTGGVCLVCTANHPVGFCPLKLAGPEKCQLCGVAHFGYEFVRNCPSLNSVTQCRAMLEALKSSPEPKAEIEYAKKYIVGVIGNLNRKKKLKAQALAGQVPGGGLNYQDAVSAYTFNTLNGDSAGMPLVTGIGRGKENHHVKAHGHSSKPKNLLSEGPVSLSQA